MFEELINKNCISIKNKTGKLMNVCIGAEEDMGKRSINIVLDEKERTFFNKTRLLTFLRKENVPREERTKVLGFVSNGFREHKVQKSRISGRIKLPGIGEVEGRRDKESHAE